MFFLVILSLSSPAQQSNKIDSLENVLKNTKDDTTQVKLLQRIGGLLALSDPKRSVEYAERMFSFIKEHEEKVSGNDKLKKFYRSYKGDAFVMIGNAYSNIGEEDKALDAHKNALKIWEELNNKRGIAGAYNNLGTTYKSIGNYPLALEHLIKALKMNEESGNKLWQGNNLNNIGAIYIKMNNLEAASKYFNQALVIRKEIEDKKGQSTSYMSLGGLYNLQKKYPQALMCYLESVRLCKELNNKTGLAAVYNNMASIFRDKNADSALVYYTKALEISKEIGYGEVECSSYLNIASIHVFKKRYEQAVANLNKGLQTAVEMNNKELVKEAYWTMSDDYLLMNNYKLAYEYHVKYVGMKDSTLNGETTKQIAEMATKYETEKKDKEILLLNKDNAINQKEIEKQSAQRNAFIIGFILVLAFAVFIFRGYKQKQKANEIIQLQKQLVEEKNKDITDSINYAKRIQEALLPAKELKYRLFPEAFVLFQPRDIVSGDFYWFAEKNGKKIIASADCTGHGVPGAFMSMIGNAFLNEIVNANGITSPAEILNQLRAQVITSLKQNNEENKDGMDISILSFDDKTKTVEFAGANNPMWLIRNGELIEFKADKQPIGFYTGRQNDFANHKIELQKNDSIYIFTDGYADQFGGEKGKKFKYKKLQDLLVEIQKETMVEQENILLKKMNDWKGSLEQVDDILIIGVRV